jgi:hypothetical protein
MQVKKWFNNARARLRHEFARYSVAHFQIKEAKHHELPSELVLSLTSYPPRYPTLELTLKSLLMQTVKPDKLILWVSGSEFDLPADVRNLRRFGLDIRVTPDIKSYKKIIPTLETFPCANIVTADDDLFYERRWLERIVGGAVPGEKVIVCRRAHRPMRKGRGYAPYTSWEHDVVTDGGLSNCLFPTSGAGALFPPGALAPEVLDRSFMTLCPHADDVWLFVMAKRAGAKFRQIGGGFAQVAWEGSQVSSLMHNNLAGDGNDRQLAAVLERYPI